MRVFVTGGTGYIGKEFIGKLLQHKYNVVAMYRSENPPWEAPGLQWWRAHLFDADAMRQGMQGCDGVFHLAGLARMWHAEKDAFFRMNVEGTRQVLRAAEEAGVGRLVFTSSAVVFSASIRTPITEDDPQLEPFDEDYAITKHLAEQEVMAAALRGMHTVIVNPPRVYGPGHSAGGTNPVNKLVAQYLSRSFYLVPGHGRYAGNYVFMDDLLEGHLLAMEKGRAGHRYILGGENHDYLSFYHTLETITGLHRRRIGVPRWLMEAVAEASENWSALTGKAPAVTHAIVRKLYSNRLLSCEKAIRELGYHITPLEEGLRQTVKSMQQP